MWFPIDRWNEGEYDVIRRISLAGTKALYSIDAADKAKAVPYIEIWQVNRETNARVSASISNQFYQNADFGKSLGNQFGERPPISVESVQVKNHMPQGWIQWRDITINIMIHRPDVLNGISDQSKLLGSLMTPGRVFLLRYGWIGGRNAALGPGGQEEELRPEYNPPEEKKVQAWEEVMEKIQEARAAIGFQTAYPQEPKFYKTIFRARDDVRFSVTHYNFTIMPDNQVKLTIHAKEDGILNVASSNIFDQDDLISKFEPGNLKNLVETQAAGQLLTSNFDYFNEKFKAGSFEREFNVPADINQPNGPKSPLKADFIELQLVFNILFAQPTVRALNNIGYKHVHLYFGAFQEKLCRTQVGYDGGQDYSGMSIGNFLMKTDDVKKILNEVISNGGQITVNNLMERFSSYLNSPAIWDLSTSQREVTSVPEAQVFTIFNPEASYARIQLSDRKRYLSVLSPVHMTQQNAGKTKSEFRKDLFKNLQRNYIPYFTLFHQSSFFQDAKFEIVQDERMRSLFIQARNQQNRTQQVVGTNPSSISADQGAIAPLVLYRSAVKGSIKMIGNFVFSYAGLVWINFSIPNIDGLFYVMQKTDNIGRDGFVSDYHMQAEGSNPLNTPPRWSGETAEDWVRQKIMACHQIYDFMSRPTSLETMIAEDQSLIDNLTADKSPSAGVGPDGWTDAERIANDNEYK